MAPQIEFGLDTFGDVTRTADGALVSHALAIRQVVEEAMKVRDSEQKRLKEILSDDFLKQFERLSKYE